MRNAARLVLLALTTATIGPGAARLAPTTTGPVSPAAARPLTGLPGDGNRFSAFDYRQKAVGPVDWPVTFVFTGKATVERVREGLCHTTAHPWKYCDAGGTMYLAAQSAAVNPIGGFLGDAGVKRFGESCSTTEFTAHMRLYAPSIGPDGHAFDSATYGQVVVATTHLDFQDHAGCSGRVHGYPDIAEQWFIEAMKTIPGWEVHRDAIDLGNGTDRFVVMRELAGVEVPHVYGNDAMATQVVIG